jgi:hypothetical protein
MLMQQKDRRVTAKEAMEKAEAALAMNEETHRLVQELHAGLMKPLPGYDKSFVTRATEVVLEAEAGKLVGEKLVWYAKLFTAIGTIATALYAAMQWGPK